MNREDMEAMAAIVRKYAVAVETTLYWKMTTGEARRELTEAQRLLAVLDAAIKHFN